MISHINTNESAQVVLKSELVLTVLYAVKKAERVKQMKV